MIEASHQQVDQAYAKLINDLEARAGDLEMERHSLLDVAACAAAYLEDQSPENLRKFHESMSRHFALIVENTERELARKKSGDPEQFLAASELMLLSTYIDSDMLEGWGGDPTKTDA